MLKSSWKNQFKQLTNSSQFHEKIRQFFCTDSMFSTMHCYQEVNVKDLIPEYQHTNHHYDWYVEEINTIIELHGDQHFKMTNYGNDSYDQTIINFKKSKYRDYEKKDSALHAGYRYIEIPYRGYKRLTGDDIRNAIINSD